MSLDVDFRDVQSLIQCRVTETLPESVLTLMHAPAKPDYPIATPATFTEYDGFLHTRFGTMPAQFKVHTPARSLTEAPKILNIVY